MSGPSPVAARSAKKDRRITANEASPLFKAGLLISMYLCQCLPMGFVFGGLPVIMRQSNVSLKLIGTLFLLQFPWALKFCIAPWVDQFSLPGVGRRKTWILPSQWIAAFLLYFLAQTPPAAEFGNTFALVLAVNIILAVNDVAVDGYATDILLPNERILGNTLQAGARFAGILLGSGLLLFLYASLGWENVCRILGAALIVLSLPTLFHFEISPMSTERRANLPDEKNGLLSFVRRKDVRRLIPILISATAFAFVCVKMRMPFLVDMGWSPAQIGVLQMRYAAFLGLLGTLGSGWLLNRIGSKRFIRLFSLVVVLMAAYTAFLSQKAEVSPWLAGLLLSLDNLIVGGINVWGFTQIMHVSAGRHAGTGFAVLSSLVLFVPMATSPVFGALGDMYGFFILYGVLSVLALLGYTVIEFFPRP
ncbi:MAG: MFS transporter [Desulfobacterales bacterium]|nr:MFS transporter [Desulfobacterales bacterium]